MKANYKKIVKEMNQAAEGKDNAKSIIIAAFDTKDVFDSFETIIIKNIRDGRTDLLTDKSAQRGFACTFLLELCDKLGSEKNDDINVDWTTPPYDEDIIEFVYSKVVEVVEHVDTAEPSLKDKISDTTKKFQTTLSASTMSIFAKLRDKIVSFFKMLKRKAVDVYVYIHSRMWLSLPIQIIENVGLGVGLGKLGAALNLKLGFEYPHTLIIGCLAAALALGISTLISIIRAHAYAASLRIVHPDWNVVVDGFNVNVTKPGDSTVIYDVDTVSSENGTPIV